MKIPGDAVMSKGNPRLRSVVNADGAALLDTRAGRITTLNSTGAMVWQALERGKAPEAIAANLAHETGEPVAAIEKDLQDFMEELGKKNLLAR